MTLIIQILLVLLIMASMVMILLSIGKLAKGSNFEDPEMTHKLKKEIEEKNNVFTNNNAFNYHK